MLKREVNKSENQRGEGGVTAAASMLQKLFGHSAQFQMYFVLFNGF